MKGRCVAPHLWVRQAGDQALQLCALLHVVLVQSSVRQLAQLGALQVRLHQAEGRAVARDQRQRLPDAVHLRRTATQGFIATPICSRMWAREAGANRSLEVLGCRATEGRSSMLTPEPDQICSRLVGDVAAAVRLPAAGAADVRTTVG